MTAITAHRQQEEVRLWAGSALAALLLHLAVAALVFLRVQWPPQPSPLAGSPAALDVELASPPSSRLEQSRSQRPAPVAASDLQPLAELRPISQQAAPPPSDATVPSAAAATGPTAELSPLAAPNPTALAQPHGEAEAAPTTEQQWLAEVNAQLQRYKQYPSSAIEQQQQDTVTLKFAVDHSGRVTYFRIDSSHRYAALEQEAQEMLQAAPLPAPPPQLPVDQIVVNVPIDFYLMSPTPSPAPAPCAAPDNPGPVPAAAAATLQQMSAYRARLSQYVAASGKQLDCLAKAPDATSLASRTTLTRQLHAMVDDFNTQARLFEAKAQAEALQAQQARERQAQALAARVYAACAPPRTPQALAKAPTIDSEQSYERNLLDYQSAVRAYLGCIRAARLAVSDEGSVLASDQRAELDRTAAQLGNAAIGPFNQLVARFNAGLPGLRQQALAAQTQSLAEALVRATAIFPDSSWSVPAPLPTDECFRITRSSQSYQAQLCNSTYVTSLDAGTQMARSAGLGGGLLAQMGANGADNAPGDSGMAQATQQESIAASHGVAGACPAFGPCTAPVLGITVAPMSQLGQQTSTQFETISYAISDLQVAGRHLSLTISRRSPGAAPSDDLSSVHFDLALSPDGQTLRGYCWTDQQRWECTLPRHLAGR